MKTGILALTAGVLLVTTPSAIPVTINVRDCGAVGDGARLNTEAIQTAIDRCANSGGATISARKAGARAGQVPFETRADES
jgi:hypothetical protein